MAPSATVNVVRYSALSFGILYGVFHRRTLQKREEHRRATDEVKKREHHIAEAKQAWQRKLLEKSTGGVVSDPEDPNFDLEALLNKLASDS